MCGESAVGGYVALERDEPGDAPLATDADERWADDAHERQARFDDRTTST
jgi:hypothetical protein